MSWGSTAYTPIVTRNQPPFGFAEVINPPDFPTCASDPYIATAYLKAELDDAFRSREANQEPWVSDCQALRNQTTQLREGFSEGATFFWLTLLGTIGCGWVSDMVAGAVATKFAPLEKIPFLDKLPKKVMSNLKVLKKFGRKVLPLSDIAYSVVLPIMAFITVYIVNTIILQIAIYQKCKRLDKDSFNTARLKALAGAIPCMVVMIVAVIVLWVLTRIPFLTIPLGIATAMGGITVALIIALVSTNFIFGGALGVTLARRDGCAERATTTPAATTAPA